MTQPSVRVPFHSFRVALYARGMLILASAACLALGLR